MLGYQIKPLNKSMPSILSSITPSVTLNYAGHGTGASRTRHVPSYTHRKLVWNLGTDNILDITVNQADRQPMNIVGRDIVFSFWDAKSGLTYFRTRAQHSTPESGALRLVVPASTTAAIEPGLYNLSATIIDGDGFETAMTWDQDHRGSIDVELRSDVMPPSRVTDVLDLWTLSDGVYVSSAVEGTSNGLRNKGLFSTAVYATNYTGTLVVQGTLDQTINGMNTLWADLADTDGSNSITLEDFTGILPLNYHYNMRWIRVTRSDHPANAGTLDKVLIRV